MNDEQRRHDLADFLRTRRMRLTPEQVGLAGGGRRRTPGLRREEVAHLAHIGLSWYILLEQGRAIHPSQEVLHSLADALQLTTDERQHLFLLANQPPFVDTNPPEEQVTPALQRVLDALTPVPAYIMGSRWNFLAWNITAGDIFQLSRSAVPYGDNAVWRMFADPRSLRIHSPKWEQVAQKVMEEFRADTVRYADEDWFKGLVAELQRISPEFRAWWPRHDVRGRSDARKDMIHPLLGRLMFEHTTLQVPAMPELKIMIYTPIPETDTMEKLEQLVNMKIEAGVLY